MKPFLIAIGTLLIILGLATMLVFVVLPAVIPFKSAPIMKNTFQAVFCKSNETLVDSRSTYTYPDRTVTTVEMDCVNDENQKRDVSGGPILVGMVGFLVPFFIGLFMVIGASNMGRTRQVYTATRAFQQTFGQGQGFSMNMSGMDINVDAEGHVIVKMPDGTVVNGHHTQFGMSSSLAQRLQEIKSAYDAGLITETEYNAKREEILREV